MTVLPPSGWAPNYPLDPTGVLDCGVTTAKGGVLAFVNEDCNALHTAMCECELPVTCAPGTGQFVPVRGTFTWAQAAGVCASQNLRLARLATGQQLDAAILSLGPDTRFWIDARDEAPVGTDGDWRASDGCRPYLRWLAGAAISDAEPTGGVFENCAALTGGGVADLMCSAEANVLCEAP